jgi:hypothetical protein
MTCLSIDFIRPYYNQVSIELLGLLSKAIP